MPSTPDLEALKAFFNGKAVTEQQAIDAATQAKHDAETRLTCWQQGKDQVQAKIDQP